MAKAIYIFSRSRQEPVAETRLAAICDALLPDHLDAGAPMVEVGPGWAMGVANPNGAVRRQGASLILGAVLNNGASWEALGSGAPDGSYAIFRSREEALEIIADPVASRTIWIYEDQEQVVASTSQRAIVAYLGSLEFNEAVLPWVLSTGGLGPEGGWDRRLERVGADTTIRIERDGWSLERESRPIEFEVQEGSDADHRRRLKRALEASFEALDIDFDTWSLPLSGGYDSRAILCLLNASSRSLEELKTFTWGLESALDDPESDAAVAREVAESVGVSHDYVHTDRNDEPIEVVLERFLICGEGRTDRLSGYMDGFAIWKRQFEAGIKGVIRGDEGFGWRLISSPLTIRLSLGGGLCSDFSNLADYEEFGFVTQALPQEMKRREDESLATWRDRLYQVYRAPTGLSAVTDLKAPYVELINPLMSRRVLRAVRRLPDKWRTEKRLAKAIIDEISPDIGYARASATASREEILRRPEVVAVMRRELEAATGGDLLPTAFVERVLSSMEVDGGDADGDGDGAVDRRGRFGLRRAVKRVWKGVRARLIDGLPQGVINMLLDHGVSPSVDPNVLAFRLYMICRMEAILEEDASGAGGLRVGE